MAVFEQKKTWRNNTLNITISDTKTQERNPIERISNVAIVNLRKELRDARGTRTEHIQSNLLVSIFDTLSHGKENGFLHGKATISKPLFGVG
jgi:hypothetical protein